MPQRRRRLRKTPKVPEIPNKYPLTPKVTDRIILIEVFSVSTIHSSCRRLDPFTSSLHGEGKGQEVEGCQVYQ
jgi:hypothetical protein